MLFGLNFINSQTQNLDTIFNKIAHQPKITHFTQEHFKADVQFWSGCTDSKNISYFGNNDGVLIYDGERWQKATLPNNSSVRSLFHASDGQIYAGGYEEFGTIKADSTGQYHYHSLMETLALSDRNIENFWQINEADSTIILRTFTEIIAINQHQQVTHIAASKKFLFGNTVNGKYYLQDDEIGIQRLHPSNGTLDVIFDANSFNNEKISAILPFKNQQLLLIGKNGKIYKGDISSGKVTLLLHLFPNTNKNQIITAIKRNDEYLLSSLINGIIVLDEEGQRKPSPSTFKNVQNSPILHFNADSNGIWLMLNNGIDYLNYNSGITKVFDDASIYDISLYNNALYLATNKGVYLANLNQGADAVDFELINQLQGPAWSINTINNSLFIGMDSGLFKIDTNIEQLGSMPGIWKMISIPNYPNHYLACGYYGLYLIIKEQNTYRVSHKIEGFNESSRDILPASEPNTYWVCHGYKGIYKIKIDNSLKRVYAIEQYTDKNGLKSPFNINVFPWQDTTVFTTNNGIYAYQKQTNSFIPFAPLNNILDSSKNTRKIVEDQQTTWVVEDDEVAYFNTSTDTPELKRDLFLNIKGKLNRGMESIFPIENNKVLIGSTEGLYLYQLEIPTQQDAHTYIRKVTYKHQNTDVNLSLISSTNEENPLPNKTELLHIDFASPELMHSGNIQYQYILEPMDASWSAWSNNNHKEYTHLSPGTYSFKVRSRDLLGNMAATAAYSFTILPKWYETTLMKIVYFLIFSLLLLGIYTLMKKRIERKNYKQQEEAKRTKKLLQLEIEQLKLQQEHDRIERDKNLLEEDMLLKSKELANFTMQLVSKKDVFNELQKDLKELRTLVKSPTSKDKLRAIFGKLHQHKIGEEYMEVFDVNFEKIHHDFFVKLKEIHPDISKKELRLASFIKMEMSNKEIAPLLNISVRGVETARYRISKKLNIKEHKNLADFLKEV